MSESTKKPFDYAGFNWGEHLKDLNKGNQTTLRPTDGKSRFRLIAPPSGEKLFVTITTSYEGKPRKRYGLLAVDLAARIEDQSIKLLVLPATCWKAIVAFLSEGFDFFSPEGLGVAIIRSGGKGGAKIQYNVIPSRKTIEILDEWKESYDGLTLVEKAKAYEKWAADLNAERDKKANKGSNGNNADAFEQDLGDDSSRKDPSGW